MLEVLPAVKDEGGFEDLWLVATLHYCESDTLCKLLALLVKQAEMLYSQLIHLESVFVLDLFAYPKEGFRGKIEQEYAFIIQ